MSELGMWEDDYLGRTIFHLNVFSGKEENEADFSPEHQTQVCFSGSPREDLALGPGQVGWLPGAQALP